MFYIVFSKVIDNYYAKLLVMLSTGSNFEPHTLVFTRREMVKCFVILGFRYSDAI